MYQVFKSSLSFSFTFSHQVSIRIRGMKNKRKQRKVWISPSNLRWGNLFTHILGGENKWGQTSPLSTRGCYKGEMLRCEHTCPWMQRLSKSLLPLRTLEWDLDLHFSGAFYFISGLETHLKRKIKIKMIPFWWPCQAKWIKSIKMQLIWIHLDWRTRDKNKEAYLPECVM